MNRKLALRALAIVPSILAGAATRGPAQPAGAPAMRVISTPSDDQLPFMYALSSGLFRAAGLDVTADRASSGAVVTQAVVGGAAEVGKTSLSSLIAAHVAGIPFVLIAPAAIHRKESSVNSAIIVATDSPVRSPLDLQGKVVSCTAIGDIGYLGLRAMIDGAGGDSSTVHWVEIPTAAAAVAIEQGHVDAGVTVEPFMTRDLASGKIRVLVDMLNGYPRPILEGAYFAMRDYVEKNRDAVGRFARVLRQATVYANAHPAEVIPLLVAATGMDPDLATKMHHAVVAVSFDASQVQPVIDAAAKYKVIPHGFDARELVASLPR